MYSCLGKCFNGGQPYNASSRYAKFVGYDRDKENTIRFINSIR